MKEPNVTKDPNPLPDQILDGLYDVALDPQELERFIGAWIDAGLDASEVRRTVARIDAFDAAFQHHLTRAETFLDRQSHDSVERYLRTALEPFETSAACVLGDGLRVVAANAGATAAYDIHVGDGLDSIPLHDTEREQLNQIVQSMQRGDEIRTKLLNFENPNTERPVFFHVKKLALPEVGMAPYILIVTTAFYWSSALSQTLEEVFTLSKAERGIVQALVQGMDAKAIASARGTSVETVRTQVRSILGKTKARSQTELIRLVLSLRDVVNETQVQTRSQQPRRMPERDWLDDEVWKPYLSLTLPDGRRMDYHVQGPPDGAPLVLTHMGYGLIRLPKPILKLCYRHGLKVIAPIRAGYGDSTPVKRSDPITDIARRDLLQLMEHLGIARMPYVPQGNDLYFAVDMASKHPDRVSEIIGLGSRPYVPGDAHYAGMGKWHRFFLSTAQHAPHLLYFTSRAAFTLARKIGTEEMFRNMNKSSPADMAIFDRPDFIGPLLESAKLVVGDTTTAAMAYAMELLQTEADWSHLMHAAKATPTRFINGLEDPGYDAATLDVYRAHYPWVDITEVPGCGQLLLFQHYEALIPLLADAARAAG